MTTVAITKLMQMVDKALMDHTYAERIFNEPDRVARESGLSENEAHVLRHMNRDLFARARKEVEEKERRRQSGELSEAELAGVTGGAGAQPQGGGVTSIIINWATRKAGGDGG